MIDYEKLLNEAKALMPLVKQRHPNVSNGYRIDLALVYANPEFRLMYETEIFTTDTPPTDVIARAMSPQDPEQAERWWRAAQDGDVEAAEWIITGVPNPLQPVVLEAALGRNMPPSVVRRMIEILWMHNWEWWECWNIWRYGLSDGHMPEIFAQAQFDISHLPEYVEIWRGTQLDPESSGDAKFYLSRSMSWTLRRPLAHWFADYRVGEMPIVGRCRLHRSFVLAHLTERVEDEIIVAPDDLQEIEIELEEYDGSIARRDP